MNQAPGVDNDFGQPKGGNPKGLGKTIPSIINELKSYPIKTLQKIFCRATCESTQIASIFHPDPVLN